MGLFSTRWEAEWEGRQLTVSRNELTKGFQLEGDGRVLDAKRWSLAGVGELRGSMDHDGRRVSVHVELPLSFPRPKCHIRVDGQAIAVRQVK